MQTQVGLLLVNSDKVKHLPQRRFHSQELFRLALNNRQISRINAQSASLHSLVAAESKVAEINAVVPRFESVCQL